MERQALRVPLRPANAAGGVRKHRPDYRIVLYMGLLMLLGLIIMYAIGPQRAQVLNASFGTDFYTATYFFGKQAISLLLALAVFFLVAKAPYSWIERYGKQLFIAGIVACVVLAIAGKLGSSLAYCSNGACRWFDLGPLGSLQPAEFLKFGLLVFVAAFIARRAQMGLINDLYKTLVPLGAIVGLLAVFIIGLQNDMGTGLSMLAIIATMMIVAGVKARVGLILLAGAAVLGILMIIVAPHRIDRVTAFLQGDNISASDPASYHVIQAKTAIGSGGLTGLGIGNSVQATGYLPEAINDSVFAIMGEVFGFVGLVVVLILFTALLLSLLKVARQLPGLREKLLVAGVFGWLASHVILNVAAMTGIFPLTGITLPLLSFGGTSMVFIAGAIGLAFQLSSYTTHVSTTEGERYENSRSGRGLGRPRYTGRSRI
jgi:cell division protein FtsW